MDAPTFLVADPNARFLEKSADIFRDAGYRVIPVLDGREARETLQRERVTGVLANLELPAVSGIDLCRFVKQQHDPRIPVVLMCAEDSDGLPAAKSAAADNLLFRPVKRAELLFCARAMIRLNEALTQPPRSSGATPSGDEITGKSQSSRLSQFEFFKAFLSVEIKRARRYGFPLSVMLTSLDRMGEIEKVHGQRVLRHLLGGLARAIRRSVRDIDIPVTLRDDTILVLMPHTDAEGAAAVAERVRQRIRRSVYRENDLVIRPTISIGETTYDRNGDRNFSQVVRRASKALRDAFRKGGDQVVVL
jgi:two-component system, cell cycle response regulator